MEDSALVMFPVYTGINRPDGYEIPYLKDVPCIHRDKPTLNLELVYLRACSLYTQG